ncbi:MAG: TrkH family potassium uptake protein, partial [Firmicutes bacterium]|nr:TrkH family potassium uptake protein [Bacillota bacterium]
MNTRMICRVLGLILLILAGLLLLPLLVGLIYREPVLHFVITAVFAAALGFLLTRIRPLSTAIYAREGFVIVGLGWILMSLLGALPFVLG